MTDACARVRSTGTDFRDMSVIEVEFADGSRDPKLSVERLQITSNIPEDPATAAVCRGCSSVKDAARTESFGRSGGCSMLVHAVLGKY